MNRECPSRTRQGSALRSDPHADCALDPCLRCGWGHQEISLPRISPLLTGNLCSRDAIGAVGAAAASWEQRGGIPGLFPPHFPVPLSHLRCQLLHLLFQMLHPWLKLVLMKQVVEHPECPFPVHPGDQLLSPFAVKRDPLGLRILRDAAKLPSPVLQGVALEHLQKLSVLPYSLTSSLRGGCPCNPLLACDSRRR